MEKYSVLITVYKNDNPSYFKAALLSMINQTIKPDEIILVKDGVIGEELQRVIDDLNKSKNVIKEIQLEKNKGLGLALNEGIKVCKNNLIARMDSDDISFLDRCEKQLLEFEKDPTLDIVGCPVIEFIDRIENQVGKRDVPKTNDEIYSYCKKRDPFNHPTVMYKKSKLEEVGMYNDLKKNQDTDLWIRMLLKNAKCKNLDKPYLYFRFDEGTYKKRKNWLNTKLLIKIRWNAYRSGFNSFEDFLQISMLQMAIYLMPIFFQKIVYKKILRS
jgi:glycosyltransferase involved in cell wall biosynthesis